MMKAALTRIWRFVRRFEARVLIGLMLAAGGLWAFLNIAEEMGEGETKGLDSRIILMLREPGDPNNPIGSRMSRRPCATSRPWAARRWSRW